MKTSRILLSTLLASAAGVAIGMLFAPQKGSKTRKQISEKNHEYSDYLSDTYHDAVDSVTHSLESVQDETEKLVKKAKK